MTYTYYRTEFEVEWGNGNTETITHESGHKADRLPRYGDRIHVDEFSHTYTRRGLILRWRTTTRGSFDTVRELNFRKIKSIDFVGREELTADDQ